MRLSEAIRLLSEAGIDAPAHDARAIFRHFENLSDTALYGADTKSQNPKTNDAVMRRAEREPLQYLLGTCDFYRETYRVTPAVLIPRSDTELLVDTVVRHARKGARILDLCTGSGCIPISILNNTDHTTATAVDLSPEALEIARENARRYDLSDRITFIEADLRTSFPDGEFDIITSNPPYIRREVYETLAPEIAKEPRMAFVADEDGLLFYRLFLERAPAHLAQGGFIALEIGYDQMDALARLCEQNGLSVSFYKDLGGNDRLAIARR